MDKTIFIVPENADEIISKTVKPDIDIRYPNASGWNISNFPNYNPRTDIFYDEDSAQTFLEELERQGKKYESWCVVPVNNIKAKWIIEIQSFDRAWEDGNVYDHQEKCDIHMLVSKIIQD